MAARSVPLVPHLTGREADILRLIADGLGNDAIAVQLHFGVGTIKVHVRDILGKLHAANRAEAAARGIRAGLI